VRMTPNCIILGDNYVMLTSVVTLTRVIMTSGTDGGFYISQVSMQ